MKVGQMLGKITFTSPVQSLSIIVSPQYKKTTIKISSMSNWKCFSLLHNDLQPFIQHPSISLVFICSEASFIFTRKNNISLTGFNLIWKGEHSQHGPSNGPTKRRHNWITSNSTLDWLAKCSADVRMNEEDFFSPKYIWRRQYGTV